MLKPSFVKIREGHVLCVDLTWNDPESRKASQGYASSECLGVERGFRNDQSSVNCISQS